MFTEWLNGSTNLAEIDLSTAIVRLGLTFVLAFVFGLERQKSRKPIGFGTFTFVATGATGLAIAAIHSSPTNPLPLLGAIVTGVGFLGAGALVKTGEKVHGFTSASMIWIFAIFGVLIGVGELVIGLITYGLIWIVTIYDRYLEGRGSGSYHSRITVATSRIIPESDIRSLLFGSKRQALDELKVDKKNGAMVVTYQVEGARDGLKKVLAKLDSVDWCDTYSVE